MKKTIYIDGMACIHCKNSVEAALRVLDGVVSVSVNLDDKCAVIDTNTDIDDAVLTAAITDIGFDVEKII